jgi:hypothetical protein
MKLIIGNTGLVGKTICETIKFDHYFNTSNINTFNTIAKDGDELFLSCLPATKWSVNKNIIEDIQNIYNIITLISGVTYSKVTLISTIDVYGDSPFESNESYPINVSKLTYGNNRYLFELLISEFVKTNELKIFRLPALFNKHIKKNILFDLINQNNLESINSNSQFQWYNLNNLPKDINKYSLKYPNEVIFNLFTEPINTMDIVNLFPNLINNVSFLDNKIVYNFTTQYHTSGYISDKETVLSEIKQLINEINGK